MAGTKHAARIIAIAAAAAVMLAGCSSGSKGGAGSGNSQAGNAHSALRTTDADWKPVADALGRTGKLGDNNTAYRVALVRNDLQVTTDGVAIKPGLSLGGYAAFARYNDKETLLMGDLVVTEAELPKVTDALQAHGIAQTALHKHLLQQSPPVWWTHVHGMGDAVQLARGLSAVLDVTSIGPVNPPSRLRRRSISTPQVSSRRWAARELPTADCSNTAFPVRTPSSRMGTSCPLRR